MSESNNGTKRERERRFILSRRPDGITEDNAEDIEQGFLGKDIPLRVRHRGEKFFITVKNGNTRDRDEFEPETPEWVFYRLWPSTEGMRIYKRRYYLACGEFTLEVDVYARAHQGLIKLEVEFPSIQTMDAWVPPDWLPITKEVTDDPQYRDKAMAIAGCIPEPQYAVRET